MNILVLSDNFTKGGLETHIDTLYNVLKKDNKIIFAFGNYDSPIKFKTKVYNNFHFIYGESIEDFVSDVNRLVKIINEEEINVIHVHPFYDIMPIYFAAHITNTKVVYTYHGIDSFTFCNSYNEEILFESAFETTISKTFLVNCQGTKAFKTMGYDNVCWLPNSVDTNLFKKNKIVKNGKWAITSRIDCDKIIEIENVIKFMNLTNIKQIDIYGDGPEKENLYKWLQEYKFPLKIELKEFSDNLYKDLDGKYNGIIGSGRSALEGLSMGYPVLITGKGKVGSLIDEQIYESTKKQNFLFTEEIYSLNEKVNQINNVNNNLEKYNLRDKIEYDFNIMKISQKFISEINDCKFTSQEYVIQAFKSISKIKNKNVNFYRSRDVYSILKSHLKRNTANIHIKNLFISASSMYDELDLKWEEIQQYIEKNNMPVERKKKEEEINQLKKENEQLKQYLNTLGFKQLLKHDLKKMIELFSLNKHK